ncbi:hypothetical protein [Methanolobus chelungpuianus]|uniref:Uncharacterized protein n=1 Tax=Methanolobus chelungpuianus TaxID=502115 RepID=A0AAE3HAT7_9EURY|nr:hypothetical protein [Methanolobus chelungpuianus]MCQ6962772.1 hypothetical protein [Methanolobus chelungpuianus]
MPKRTSSQNVHPKFTEHINETTCISIVNLRSDESSESIAKMARKATSRAARDALRNGRAITIQQGNAIVRKFPDGNVEVVKTLENAYFIPQKRVYRI